jgi:hypothetical protein
MATTQPHREHLATLPTSPATPSRLRSMTATMQEPALIVWRVPAGTTVSIQASRIDDAHVILRAHGLFKPKHRTPVKFPDLTHAEIEDRPFELEVEEGGFFRLLLEISYLASRESEVSVRVAARDTGGEVVQDLIAAAECDVECRYRGEIGENGQDHLTVFVGGAE